MSGRSESLAAIRKRVLLGLLADAEAERTGQIVDDAALEQSVRWYRARFDLLRRSELEAFLASTDLSPQELRAQLRTACNVARVYQAREPDIDALMPRYRAIFSVRDWLVQREEGT